MIESPLTAAERAQLQEAVSLIRRAFGLLERFAEDYEKSHDIAELFQHRRIMKIVRSDDDTVERKVEKIAEIIVRSIFCVNWTTSAMKRCICRSISRSSLKAVCFDLQK